MGYCPGVEGAAPPCRHRPGMAEPLTSPGAYRNLGMGSRMQDPSWSYETTLAAEPVSAPRARAFVCRHLIEHRAAYLVDPVRLVVSELATNAIVHARTPFTVTLSCVDRTVRLAVRQESPVPQVPAQRQPNDLSSRARRIVELVSSDWSGVSDTPASETVWASFDLRHHPLTSLPPVQG